MPDHNPNGYSIFSERASTISESGGANPVPWVPQACRPNEHARRHECSTQLKRGRQPRTHDEHNDQNTTTNNRQQKYNTRHMSQNAANAKEAWVQKACRACNTDGNADQIITMETLLLSVGSRECVLARSTLALHCSDSVADRGTSIMRNQVTGHALGGYSSKTAEESPAKRHLSFSSCLALFQHLALPLLC